jgi:hypothetical protein
MQKSYNLLKQNNIFMDGTTGHVSISAMSHDLVKILLTLTIAQTYSSSKIFMNRDTAISRSLVDF